MTSFSPTSQARLSTCHKDLQTLFQEVVRNFDCTILEGHRDQAAQDKAFATGKSKLKWPHGKHNTYPSKAVDVAPAPIDWQDRERFIYFAGYVMGIAARLGLDIRWGGDWNKDTQLKDNSFDDLVHFELRSTS